MGVAQKRSAEKQRTLRNLRGDPVSVLSKDQSFHNKTLFLHKRPLAPHLGHYRFTLPMFLSITHRASEIFLFLCFCIWAGCMLLGVSIQPLLSTPLGCFALWVCVCGLVYHLLGFMLHMLHDAGFGFSLKAASRLGLGVLFVWISVALAYGLKLCL